MRMTHNGLEFLAAWEGGVRTEVYDDVAGYPTIGVGHLIVDGEDFSEGITEAQGLAMFRQDVAVYEEAVTRNVRVDLTPHQADALISWTFNLGERNLRASTLLKRVNAGKHPLVPEQILRWTRAGGRVVRGLERRRAAEADVYAYATYRGP